MKRDMDLVRHILLHVEQQEGDPPRGWFTVEGYDEGIVAKHIQLMQEAGLVEAHVYPPSIAPARHARIERLTWEGHDFLEATRNESVWARTKQYVQEKGGAATFEIVKAVAVRIAMQHMGLPNP